MASKEMYLARYYVQEKNGYHQLKDFKMGNNYDKTIYVEEALHGRRIKL